MPDNMPVLLALIGACLAFLRYNFNPATIFLGDTGSMFLGFTLGVISLQTFNKSTFVFSLTIPLMVLGVPIYDALLAIWRRSARMWLSGDGSGKRRGIMQPDLDHLHHRLVKAGISTRRVALLLCFGNLALVMFGLLITMFRSHASGIFLVAFLAGAYIVVRHLSLIELRDTGTALLGGIQRPTHATVKALAGPIWDMVWMAGAVAVCMRLIEQPTENFWHRWFLDLPVWVTPTFSLLAISNSYVTVWSRARMRDLLKLAITLQLGLLISLGIALLIDPYRGIQKWILWTLVTAAFCHPAMLASRVMYRLIEELVNWTKSQSEPVVEGSRVLLYGAGGRCRLFLRERAFQSLGSSDNRQIVGVVDDETSLHFQYVYGYRVLGGGKDLPRLVAAHKINGVIITALLDQEARAALQALATLHGLQITEWRCQEETVPPPPISKPALGAEFIR
jgi:UDP-GlcNAc:undecaprenyl-phosphate GlcNAc-1-phosphate transferase